MRYFVAAIILAAVLATKHIVRSHAEYRRSTSMSEHLDEYEYAENKSERYRVLTIITIIFIT